MKVKEESAPYGRRATLGRRGERPAWASCAEQRVILRNVSWETFERLLSDVGDSRGTRFAYDGGTLEIMSPYFKHEGANRAIALMVYVLADELDIDCESLGSLTCKRKDLLKGIEPDSCFFIQNASAIRGIDDFDLAKHPPPDLMLEVDISGSSMSKLNICAAIGVPEVWILDHEALRFFVLHGGKYSESEESSVLPFKGLRSALLVHLARLKEIGSQRMLREFRKFVKKAASKKGK